MIHNRRRILILQLIVWWLPVIVLSSVVPKLISLEKILFYPWWKKLWKNEFPHVVKKLIGFTKSRLRVDTVENSINKNQKVLEKETRKIWWLWWASYRYALGMPYEYAWGEAEFLGQIYQVNQAVLIPRPETEELVTNVIKEISQCLTKMGITDSGLNILDIGTGSGVIAISLQHAFPRAKITAIDISWSAIQTARRNFQQINHLNGMRDNKRAINFIVADIFTLVKEEKIFFDSFDIIVSNPPYIGTKEIDSVNNNSSTTFSFLSQSVFRYEPKEALFAGENGLSFYQKLATILKDTNSTSVTNNNISSNQKRKSLFPRKLYLEMSFNQADSLKNIFSDFTNHEVKIDFAGKKRFFSMDL